jgi:hypothetical protein
LFSFCFVHNTVSNDKTPLTDFIFTSHYLVIQETEDDTARTCKRCSAGKFLADGGDDQSQHDSERDCVPCKTKTYSLDGARFCSQCEVGKYEVNENGTIIGCALCEPGSFSNTPGSVKCAACPVGKYQNEVGLPFCLPCLPGRYQNEAGEAKCQDCENGWFQNLAGNTTCRECPSGYENALIGSTSCNAVPPGSYSHFGSVLECQAGYYCKGKSANQTACAAGTFADRNGSISCIECAPGTYAALDASTTCNDCGDDEFQGFAKASSCNKIKSGHYRSGPTTEVECPAGKAGSGGSAPCNDCLTGFYQNNVGKPTCRDCPVGWSSEDGSVKCAACGAGTYGDGCNNCPLGFARKGNDMDATQCQQCKLGETTTIEGAATCNGCDLGTYGISKGKCAACPAGQYQDGKGETFCKECEVDTYLNEPGKSSKADCTACSADRSTGTTTRNTNASACLCKRTNYYQNENNICEPCPIGADCSFKDGIVLEELSALPGYWRSTNQTLLFADCKDSFSSALDPSKKAIERCPGFNRSTVDDGVFHPDLQCNKKGEESYGGPMCMACLNHDFTTSNDGTCMYCKGGSSLSSVISVLATVMGLLFLIFAVIFMKVHHDHEVHPTESKKAIEKNNDQKKRREPMNFLPCRSTQHSDHTKGCCGGIHKKPVRKLKKKKKKKATEETKAKDDRQMSSVSTFLGNQVLIGRIEGDGTKIGSETAHREDVQIIIDRVKVLFGWLQIFTSLTVTFDCPWPIEFREFSLGLNFINLDFSSILSGTACTLSLPYLQKMVVQISLPFMLLLTVVLARIPAWFLRKKERHKQRAMMIEIIIGMSLILYPALCSRLFSSLKVITVPGLVSATHSGDVLSVDYSIEAFGPTHMPYVYLAIAATVVFVLGIPLGIFIALKSNRQYLYLSNEKHHHAHAVEKHEDLVDEFGALYLQ